MVTSLTFAGFSRVFLLDSPWDRMGEAGKEKVRGGEVSIRLQCQKYGKDNVVGVQVPCGKDGGGWRC